jgi:hypothetical protein
LEDTAEERKEKGNKARIRTKIKRSE